MSADQSPPRPPAASHPAIVIALILCCVTLAQLWIVSAGTWWDWPNYTSFYSDQTVGFLHGHLSLGTQPKRALVALADPYDPVANFDLRYHDAVFFQGKYYLFWGPVPALAAAAVCCAMGISHPDFGDQYLAGFFIMATVLLAGGLILEIRRRFYPRQRITAAAMAIFSLGLGTPVLFTLARAAVYEAAIAAGQFFLLAGFCAAWSGLNRRRTWRMAAAGVCWALSVGSRVSLAPAVAVIALLTCWRIGRSADRVKSRMAALLAPLLAAGMLLGWYNFARFGSISEFGLHYQLAGRDQHSVPMSALTSPRYLLPNLALYLFMPWQSWPHFPFVFARDTSQAMKGILHLPDEYDLEAVIGVVCSQPFMLFAIAGAIGSLAWKRRSGDAAKNHDPQSDWLIHGLLAGTTLGIAPALLMRGATMRYLLDAVPCCTILAAAGYFRCLQSLEFRPRLRKFAKGAAAVVVAGEGVLGILLGLTGYFAHFALYNQPLYNAMQSFFNGL